ncbi:hypothetical protein D9M72_632990 [compost metagenome]
MKTVEIFIAALKSTCTAEVAVDKLHCKLGGIQRHCLAGDAGELETVDCVAGFKDFSCGSCGDLVTLREDHGRFPWPV